MMMHIFKIIWAERNVNIWILIELVLVFCILWFCVDYMSFLFKRQTEPRGFDIGNVYSVTLGIKDEDQAVLHSGDEAKKGLLADDFWVIIDRIKQYPDVEYTSLSIASAPYSPAYTTGAFTVDSINDFVQIKSVTPEFFDVYKIKIEKGQIFNEGGAAEIIIGGNEYNEFLKYDIMALDSVTFIDRNTGNKTLVKIAGIANKTKRSEYNQYNAIAYVPWEKDDNDFLDYIPVLEISVRLRSNADSDFVENFTKKMQDQIAIGTFFLSSVQPLREARESYLISRNYDNNIKSIYAIFAFILINIFLAVVGTFWIRIQSRRSEIGLRIALGSTKTGLRKIFINEAFILLLLASFISAIVCVNISLVDVLAAIGMPSADREKGLLGQYLLNYGFTFLFLLLIIMFAVWYPAWKASRIQPAVVLRDE